MKSHLADDVLLELVESGQGHAHLAKCARCRARVEDAREALRLAAGVQIPEPSPLFWDHLSSRVRATLSDGNVPAMPAQTWRRVLAWWPLWASAVVLVVAVVAWQMGYGGFVAGPAVQESVLSRTTTEPQASVTALEDQDMDSSWMLVTDAASAVDLDSALQAGFALAPGSAETAATQLSEDEQRELVRLLQSAVERTGSE